MNWTKIQLHNERNNDSPYRFCKNQKCQKVSFRNWIWANFKAILEVILRVHNFFCKMFFRPTKGDSRIKTVFWPKLRETPKYTSYSFFIIKFIVIDTQGQKIHSDRRWFAQANFDNRFSPKCVGGKCRRDNRIQWKVLLRMICIDIGFTLVLQSFHCFFGHCPRNLETGKDRYNSYIYTYHSTRNSTLNPDFMSKLR